ncbi:MAG: hypothetical protein ABI867_38155 [Kofleriaceae bacterium]
MKAIVFVFISLSASLSACNAFDPNLGTAPYLCPEGDCPSGFTCTTTSDPAPKDKVCVAEGGLAPDSGSSGFQCLDDSGFGQNDTIGMAFVTPVNNTMPMFSALAAICPEVDKDNYAMSFTAAMTSVEAIVTWESGNPVNVALLGASGNTLKNGVPMGDLGFRACVTNLPAGQYYASAFAAATVKNNYRIAIKTIAAADCPPGS